MKPKISIIVPVYNTERFLEECIKSIINQTYRDFEAIFINDGSPDNSLEILKEYAKKDSRIKIINQKNQGVSVARNNGIKQAKGEWIYIFDSDDFLDIHAMDELIKFAESQNADLINFNWYEYKNENDIIYRNNIDRFEDPKNWVAFTAWNLFFKRSYLIKYPFLRFPKNIHPAEDTAFTFMVLSIIKKVYFLDKALIYYRQHENMITLSKLNQKNKKNFVESCNKSIQIIINFMENHPKLKKERYEAYFKILNHINYFCKKSTGKKVISFSFLKKTFPDKWKELIFDLPIVQFIYRKKNSKSGKIIIKIFKIPVFYKPK